MSVITREWYNSWWQENNTTQATFNRSPHNPGPSSLEAPLAAWETGIPLQKISDWRQPFFSFIKELTSAQPTENSTVILKYCFCSVEGYKTTTLEEYLQQSSREISYSLLFGLSESERCRLAWCELLVAEGAPCTRLEPLISFMSPSSSL